ncbi:MAG: DUF1552 domain-containing protein [Polyangiaceae bacterium]|nr:DUF1552 domain-containing protein [Polyangiaceae bacterium]
MMNKSRRDAGSRRRFLRGACSAALALPMLEWFTPAKPAAAAATPPRFLTFYMPNGRVPEWWVPSMAPGSLTFSGQSAALQPFANRCLSLVNLDNIAARLSPGAAHAMGTGTIMTGSTIPDLVGLKNNISIDQVIANELNPSTRFKSLQWSAGEPGPCDVGGASCAYTQSISWAGPSSPLIPTIDPLAAFDRMFASATDGLKGPAAETRKRSLVSVLDFVDEDAKALQSRLGKNDKERLEEYFTSLRELEKSLTAESATCDVPEPNEVGIAGSLPYAERVDAFFQLIKLAFQCDQTRILTFMVEFGLSGRSHDFLGAPGQHHALSHYGGNAGTKALLEKVESWHSQKIADLLGILASTTNPEGVSLLDETVVLCIASMGWGDPHDHAGNSPLIFGGGGIVNCNGGQIAPGMPLPNLHATLLQGYGISGTFGPNGAIFGDHGTGTIPGVLV